MAIKRKERIGSDSTIIFSFQKTANDYFDLFTINDKQGILRLTKNNYNETTPVWSPNFTKFVYKSWIGDKSKLKIMNKNGAQLMQFEGNDDFQSIPKWSLDGEYLAYQSGNNEGLFISNTLSGQTTYLRLEKVVDFVWKENNFSSSLLILSNLNNQHVSLSEYSIQGDKIKKICDADYLLDSIYIRISPDGNKIAYTKDNTDDESFSISLYVSDIREKKRKYIGSVGDEGIFVWSYDSKKIAFVAMEDFKFFLYSIDLKENIPIRLFQLNIGDESGEILPSIPTWDPNSLKIAISSYMSKGSFIFLVDYNGTDKRQIVETEGFIPDLSWGMSTIEKR
jgi:Tol biopolymer transport system component